MQAQNQPIFANPNMNPAPQRSSGCGCCGCLTGCLFVLFLPFLVLAVLYFTVDMGRVADQGLQWWYREVVRAKVLEPSLPANLSSQEKQEALQVADQVIEDYMNLPEAQKKLIRKEALTYFYYDLQNKPVPPAEIKHLTTFIQGQVRKLENSPLLPLLDPSPPAQPPKGLPSQTL